MKNKKVSVIVPVYKVEAYLLRCTDSILNQSYKNLEIILVDDGSPDNCGQLCETIATSDPRVVVIHKENGGLSSARNKALDIMTGDYLTFVDSDDAIHANMIELMVEEIENNNSDIVTTGLLSFDGSIPELDTVDIRFERLYPNDFINHLYPDNFGKISVTACGKLYKKDLFTELRYPEGVIYEDLRVYLPLLQMCNQISVINEPLYFWYNNMQSITRSEYLQHDRFGEFSIREGYIDFFLEKGLIEQAQYAANDYLTFFMRNYFAVMLKYKMKKKDLKPYIALFRKHMDLIMSSPYSCRMRKVCAQLMLFSSRMAYIIAKRTIPDCIIEEMR